MAQLGRVFPGSPGRNSYPPSPPSPEAADEVSLRRLLQVASPTPAQVVVIARGILEALKSLPAGELPDGGLSLDQVQVGVDGQVRLSGRATASVPTITSLPALLGELALAAGQPPPCATSRAAGFLAALQAAAKCNAPPDADVEQVAALLERVAGTSALDGVRTEIATLVASVLGSRTVPGRRQTPPPRAPGDRDPPDRQDAGGRAADAARRTVPRAPARRLWPWLAAIAVFATAVMLEIVFLHGQLAHDVHVLLGRGRSGAAATASPGGRTSAARVPAAVQLPAPPAAGAVTGVSLRPLRPCTTAAICEVRVVVLMSRRVRPVVLRWGLEVVDRCTGARRTELAPAILAGARSTAVYAVGSVALPSARSLAVIAITIQPARAAGGPLIVPAGGGRCEAPS